jgi:hypothetical protein
LATLGRSPLLFGGIARLFGVDLLGLVAACPACVVCDGFGFVRNTAAAAFDVFYWLQVRGNFGDMPLLQSAPNRPDYIDI